MNRYWITMMWTLLVSLPALAGPPVFDSGSDGSDGALDLTGESGLVLFDPVASGLDPDGDNVFHFTTITIPSGVTLRLRGLELQFAPVYWLAQGAVQIDGTIDLSGEAGHDNAPGNRRPSMPGPGGFPGGVGGTPDSPAQPGLGPGGGPAIPGAQGGSHGTRRHSGCFGSARPPYGNLFLIPLTGGSGGGGDNSSTPGNRFGGGAGGGAILVASSESIGISGAIRSEGGDTGARCAGPGAGGGIRLLAPVISGEGTISTADGQGPGIRAGDGRIRIEAFQNDFTGSIVGVSRIATLSPNAIILPDSLAIPSIRITQIAGIDVSDVPSGSFLEPDVTIDTGKPVELTIEARNVPTGASLTLHLYPETGPDVTVQPQHVAGDEAASTWTASATFPNGFSRTFVFATWSP